MTKLNQIIAVEKGVKSRAQKTVTDVYHVCQKPALFNGFEKTYQPKDEEGEVFPAEKTRVQQNTNDLIRQVTRSWAELFDVTATKDFGNTEAKADVVVNGTTLVAGAPATFLLFLEKQLTDIRSFIAKLPTLDPAKDWRKDENVALFKTDVRQSIKTKKVPRAMVLHEGNEHHPPQTQVVTEDIIVGHWNQVDFSGAFPETRQQEMAERVETLLKAVKMAREKANDQKIEKKEVGNAVLEWLFTG